jgi:glycosyltransferase involved in cell wall biosynthesis
MLRPRLRSNLSTSGFAILTNSKSASDHKANPSGPPAREPAILQVIPSLDAGGAERTTVDVAAALAREGFQPLVASRGGRMETELVVSGGELIKLPLDTKAPHALAANAYRLRDLIRTRNIALVHARSRAPAWSALWAARMAKVPFVTTYHGIYNASNPLKRLYNSVMARADAVIANSQWTAAHIRSQYRFAPKNLVVIPRGIDLASFDPAGVASERAALLRAMWGVRDDDTVILLPGRLTRWKGQTVFIDALAQLQREGRLAGVRALLAGDPQGRTDYVSELRKAIVDAGLRDIVVIPGHTGDMPAAYLASDIVVSASTDPEAFGRVSAEASAMARPVIATNHGGSRETVLPGTSGLLVPPGDAKALANALAQLLSLDATSLLAMGMKGRAHIASQFTVEKMCADTIAVYRMLLAEKT